MTWDANELQPFLILWPLAQDSESWQKELNGPNLGKMSLTAPGEKYGSSGFYMRK